MTFGKLRVDAQIFEELKKNPSWWIKFEVTPKSWTS